MKVYNIEKNIELKDYDLNKGRLVADKKVLKIIPEQKFEPAKIELKQVNRNAIGDIEYKPIIVKDEVPYKPKEIIYEDIYVYMPYSAEEQKNYLRDLREEECFSIINQNFIIDGKSVTWFDTLTEEQKIEANEWVQAWRDVTDTLEIPDKPEWLK